MLRASRLVKGAAVNRDDIQRAQCCQTRSDREIFEFGDLVWDKGVRGASVSREVE
jgi:hypothetical protein